MGGKGSGGKNKKPKAIAEAQGNPGHRRLNENEPVVAPGSPRMPDGMSAQAKKFWDELLPIVTEMRVMTKADAIALGELCMALDRRMQAEAMIQQFTILIPTKNEAGQVVGVKMNPAVRVASDAERHVRAGLAAFGLDPSSRSKLNTEDPDGPPSDPLENIRRAKTSSDSVQ